MWIYRVVKILPLSNFDAREVTMHYKRKGDRVDEVLHDIVLNHVNRLEHENKRLREALEFYASEKTYETDVTNQWEPVTLIDSDNGKRARQALEGDKP